jgi:L-serine dehydratase
MERLSIFDIYKIGVGPSSSHTLGPWNAALQFVADLQSEKIDQVEVHLYGSLSKTGKGHATDIAIQLGLEGFQPETIATEQINHYIHRIKSEQSININKTPIFFAPSKQIIFHNHTVKAHPNTMILKAFYQKKLINESTYYSLGGGFIQKEGEETTKQKKKVILPYPIDKGNELLAYTNKTGLSISEIVFINELHFQKKEIIKKKAASIFYTMLDSVYKGCHTNGILPGGLNVKRRAKALNNRLLKGDYDNAKDWLKAIKKSPKNFSLINQWISCFALAVNEENAALGRVVTSPTNGASGVIPAVLLYFYCFCKNRGMSDIQKFLLTSGEIGCLFKKGATISAAVGGCQAEIGVSSAMAAGGLTEVLGGSPQQVLMAAEIAMEHHLGLTCDPIGGLVQIPCIERNTMGAMKAITASNLALSGNPDDAIVNFDLVVKTMWDTAQEMNSKYKETSEGGLAYNLPVILPEC